MGKKIRIKDIANRLGLSSTLVSLVLNNKADQQGIKRETQEKVLAAAHQLGYYNQSKFDSPDEVKDEHPGIVGMIVPSLSDPFLVDLVPYMQKALASIGIGLSVMTRDPFDKRFVRLIPGFKKFFSGLILIGETADETTIRALRSSDYPFIVLESCIDNVRLNMIRSDCEAGAEMLSLHIRNLAYKNITLVSREHPVDIVLENILCMERCLKENLPDARISSAVIARIPGINTIDTDILAGYLRPPFHTDVFVVTEASLVYPIVKYFNESKIRIPQDVALVSTEDGIGFDLMATPITRIRRQIPELASKASKMIWTEIKNSGKSKYRRSVNIAPELIVGRSCGTIN